MSAEEMRIAIAKVYSGRRWKEKVHNMSDEQVMAIYFSFLESGKFDKKKKPAEKPNQPQEEVRQFKPFIGEQLSLF